MRVAGGDEDGRPAGGDLVHARLDADDGLAGAGGHHDEGGLPPGGEPLAQGREAEALVVAQDDVGHVAPRAGGVGSHPPRRRAVHEPGGPQTVYLRPLATEAGI